MSNAVAKYQKYAEYKDSGVEWLGEIPSHWNQTYLKYVVLINMGQSPSSEDCNIDGIGIPFLQGNAEFGTYSPTAKNYCPIPKKIADKGDLLFSVRAPVGALNYADMQYGIGRGLCSLKSRSSINSSFLWWVLPTYKYQLDAIATGSTFEAVSAEEVANLKFPLPTIVEQQKIANFLDHETTQIDTLIAKQEKLIELLKEKRQAVISHVVTKGLNPDVAMKDSGVEWLGQVPEHWTVSKLKHFVNVVDCKHITAEFFDEGIPLASIGEVKGWKVNLSNAKLTNEKCYQELIDGNRKPQVGDIIYTRNATVGEASLVHAELPKFALGQDVCLIHIIQKLSSEYLLHFLKSEIIKIQLNLAMVGSTFKRINVDDIRNYVIVIPPIEEQECILKELDQKIEKYDSLINFAVKQIQLMQERRTALISSAVTGKIDVRNWQHPNEAKTELSA